MLNNYTKRTLLREVLLGLLAALWWVPFYVLVSTSLKTAGETYGNALALPGHPTGDSYAQAWGQGDLGHALLSSCIITVGTVVVLILLAPPAAYVIARRGGRLGSLFYVLSLIGIILPFQLAVVPLYSALNAVGLVGSYAGMILLYVALLLPLAVFLYTGFIRALPRDYEEAASVDGASQYTVLRRIVLPLLGPITATVGILAAIIIWNDFFVQLIFVGGTQYQTLPVAIYSFVGQYASQWNVVFAAIAISILPVLVFYIIAQKQLIRGFTGGVKA